MNSKPFYFKNLRYTVFQTLPSDSVLSDTRHRLCGGPKIHSCTYSGPGLEMITYMMVTTEQQNCDGSKADTNIRM